MSEIHWSHYIEPGGSHCLLCGVEASSADCFLHCKRTALRAEPDTSEPMPEATHLGQMHCGRSQIDAYGTSLTVEFVISGEDYELGIATSTQRAYLWVQQLYDWLREQDAG